MLTFFFGLIARSQNLSETKKPNDMEQQIIAVITDIFAGADERNWQKIEKTFAEKVLIDYTSLNGGKPSSQKAAEVTAGWAKFLPGFDSTHHEVKDFKVTIKGNVAAVHYNGKGDHYLDGKVWAVAGTFDTELKKRGDLWQVTKHKFNLAKQTGDTALPKKAAEVVKTAESKSNREEVTFNSDGLIISGNLYKPRNFDSKKRYPAVLVGGSWTTVKEQMSGLYAAKFAEEGFIALAIDPRYFGKSEGQPRFWENPAAKIADYTNSITFLETVGGVDGKNIFLVAICASAGYMANVVEHDKRVKGFATVAAWIHDAETVKPLYGGGEAVQLKIRQGKEARKKFAESGQVDYVLTVSKTDKTAAMSGDFPYYMDAKRGAIPEWSADKFAVMSWVDWLTFDAMPVATRIQIPTIMIHADSAALPGNVKKFFNDIPHNKKLLHWTEGTQFDFYDQPKQVSESVAAVTRFFKKLAN